MRRAAALLILFSSWVQAAVSQTPTLGQTPKTVITQFVQGTDAAGTYKTLYTGGANGSKIIGLFVGNTDATVHAMQFQVSNSTSDHCVTSTTCASLTTLNIVGGAGNDGSHKTNTVLSAVGSLPGDADGNPVVYLPGSTYTMEVTYATALNTGKELDVVVLGVDF